MWHIIRMLTVHSRRCTPRNGGIGLTCVVFSPLAGCCTCGGHLMFLRDTCYLRRHKEKGGVAELEIGWKQVVTGLTVTLTKGTACSGCTGVRRQLELRVHRTLSAVLVHTRGSAACGQCAAFLQWHTTFRFLELKGFGVVWTQSLNSIAQELSVCVIQCVFFPNLGPLRLGTATQWWEQGPSVHWVVKMLAKALTVVAVLEASFILSTNNTDAFFFFFGKMYSCHWG